MDNKAVTEYMYKTGMSQPTILSECESPIEKKNISIQTIQKNDSAVGYEYGCRDSK